MKRNANATCGTCPYWHEITESGECRHNTPDAYTFESGEVEFHLSTHNMHWCGQHPDFWEAEAAEQCAPDCEPLEEIVRLLNDNEHAEALKGLRRMHGLVDRFVCDKCVRSFDRVQNMACPACGAWVTPRVVIEPKEDAE